MEEQDVIKIIEKMGEFMKNTNEMLVGQQLQIDNQQLDIDKLKKQQNKSKIVIPSGVIGGNGEKQKRIV